MLHVDAYFDSVAGNFVISQPKIIRCKPNTAWLCQHDAYENGPMLHIDSNMIAYIGSVDIGRCLESAK